MHVAINVAVWSTQTLWALGPVLVLYFVCYKVRIDTSVQVVCAHYCFALVGTHFLKPATRF